MPARKREGRSKRRNPSQWTDLELPSDRSGQFSAYPPGRDPNWDRGEPRPEDGCFETRTGFATRIDSPASVLRKRERSPKPGNGPGPANGRRPQSSRRKPSRSRLARYTGRRLNCSTVLPRCLWRWRRLEQDRRADGHHAGEAGRRHHELPGRAAMSRCTAVRTACLPAGERRAGCCPVCCPRGVVGVCSENEIASERSF
jgi:hypothetical protein